MPHRFDDLLAQERPEDRPQPSEPSIVLSPLAIFQLRSFEFEGTPREWMLHISTSDDATTEREIANVVTSVVANPEVMQGLGPAKLADGLILPVRLHRELGGGWLYLRSTADDPLSMQALALLAAHAENALYSALAQEALSLREGPFYDSPIV